MYGARHMDIPLSDGSLLRISAVAAVVGITVHDILHSEHIDPHTLHVCHHRSMEIYAQAPISGVQNFTLKDGVDVKEIVSPIWPLGIALYLPRLVGLRGENLHNAPGDRSCRGGVFPQRAICSRSGSPATHGSF